MRNFYVYTYSRPDGIIFYVGKGYGKRMYDHLKDANNPIRHDHKLNIIRSLAIQNQSPIIRVVQDNLTEQEAFDLEKQLIKKYGRSDLGLGTLANHTDGGEGVSGLIVSEETKIKIGKASKGNKYPGVGPNNHNFGKPLSEETRNKISEALKGNQCAKGNRSKIKAVNQLDMNGNLIKTWDSATEAAHILREQGFKVDQSAISKACRSLYGWKSCGGFRWEYQQSTGL